VERRVIAEPRKAPALTVGHGIQAGSIKRRLLVEAKTAGEGSRGASSQRLHFKLSNVDVTAGLSTMTIFEKAPPFGTAHENHQRRA
jgi:hypothetical protein